MTPGLLLSRWLILTGWLLLAACSLGVAWWAPAETPQALVEMLPPFLGPPVIQGEVLRAYTDRGRSVDLMCYPEQPSPSAEVLAAEERWLRRSGLSSLLTRVAPPTGAYVCHDWVFTGGRHALVGNPVAMILEDNGYEEISCPRAGDLAVYSCRGVRDIMHTGVVSSADGSGSVLVESKWSWMGRYIHPADVYCNPAAVCSFYRSTRPGHLLRSLQRPAPMDSGRLLATPHARPDVTAPY